MNIICSFSVKLTSKQNNSLWHIHICLKLSNHWLPRKKKSNWIVQWQQYCFLNCFVSKSSSEQELNGVAEVETTCSSSRPERFLFQFSVDIPKLHGVIRSLNWGNYNVLRREFQTSLCNLMEKTQVGSSLYRDIAQWVGMPFQREMCWAPAK